MKKQTFYFSEFFSKTSYFWDTEVWKKNFKIYFEYLKINFKIIDLKISIDNFLQNCIFLKNRIKTTFFLYFNPLIKLWKHYKKPLLINTECLENIYFRGGKRTLKYVSWTCWVSKSTWRGVYINHYLKFKVVL